MWIPRIALVLWLGAAGCASQRAPAPSPAASAPAARTAPAPSPATQWPRRTFMGEALAAYGREDWATCARLLEAGTRYFGAARCHARAGDRDRAFAMLDLAIADGHLDPEDLASSSDLGALRADRRWEPTQRAADAKLAERRARGNPELRQLYEADQADRQADEIDWAQVRPRDAARQKRVDEILAAGGAKVADDYFHAAMVFQHGGTTAYYQRAHDLARKAVELDPRHADARWLAAASEDRKLMNEDKPQKWGTQFRQQDGKVVLWEVDRSITDEQREEWDVPPLAIQRAHADEMNQGAP